MRNIIKISLIYSIGFGIIETIMRQLDIFLFNKSNIEHQYTTPHQFIISLLWTPMLLHHKKINNKIIRYLTYPANIYLCEFISGSILLYVFEYRAWHYTDDYALLNGMITLSYYPLWIILCQLESSFYDNFMSNNTY